MFQANIQILISRIQGPEPIREPPWVTFQEPGDELVHVLHLVHPVHPRREVEGSVLQLVVKILTRNKLTLSPQSPAPAGCRCPPAPSRRGSACPGLHCTPWRSGPGEGTLYNMYLLGCWLHLQQRGGHEAGGGEVEAAQHVAGLAGHGVAPAQLHHAAAPVSLAGLQHRPLTVPYLVFSRYSRP